MFFFFCGCRSPGPDNIIGNIHSTKMMSSLCSSRRASRRRNNESCCCRDYKCQGRVRGFDRPFQKKSCCLLLPIGDMLWGESFSLFRQPVGGVVTDVSTYETANCVTAGRLPSGTIRCGLFHQHVVHTEDFHFRLDLFAKDFLFFSKSPPPAEMSRPRRRRCPQQNERSGSTGERSMPDTYSSYKDM